MDWLVLLQRLKATLMPYQKMSAVRSERKLVWEQRLFGARTGETGRQNQFFWAWNILREKREGRRLSVGCWIVKFKNSRDGSTKNLRCGKLMNPACSLYSVALTPCQGNCWDYDQITPIAPWMAPAIASICLSIFSWDSASIITRANGSVPE